MSALLLAFLQTVEGVKREVFPNLNELISKFEKPNQGLMFHLVNPIKRTRSCLRWRRSKIELDGIYGKNFHGGPDKSLSPTSTTESIQITASFYDVSSRKPHPANSIFLSCWEAVPSRSWWWQMHRALCAQAAQGKEWSPGIPCCCCC